MAYDPFNIYGGPAATASKGTVPVNRVGGTAKSGAGGIYDPFGINQQTVSTPIPTPAKVSQPTNTQPKNQQSVIGKIGSFLNSNIVQPTVNTAEKAANTVAAGGAGLVGLGTAGVQAATGNKQGANNTLAGTQQEINTLLTHGAGNKGGYLTPQQAASSGGGVKSLKANFLKPTAQATTDIAPLVVPLGGATKGASLLARVGEQSLQNAAVGGTTQLANEAINGQLSKDNGGQIAKSIIQGAALGAGGELLHTGIKGAANVVKENGPTPTAGAKEFIQNAKTNAVLQAVNKPSEVSAKTGASATTPAAELPSKVPTEQTPVAKGSSGSQTKSTPAAAPVEPAPTKVAPLDNPTAIKQAFRDTYKPSERSTANEAGAADYIHNDPVKALNDYNTRVQGKFGATNVVSGDEAKYVIPGFDSTKSASYHEPASALAKVKYQQLLQDPVTKDKPVLIMSGGSGSGKTSALKRLGINFDNYAAVVDTNSNKIAGTEARIKQAVDSGRQVEVFHVNREPVKAFTNGVIPRGNKEGRIVPIENHIETHYGSHETVQALHEKYKSDPRVDFTIASNNHGHGKARAIGIDELPKMKYTKDELRTILQKEVDHAHAAGKITPEEHALYHTPNGETVGASADRRLESERPTGSVGGKESPRAESPAKPSEQIANKPEQGTSKVAQRIAKDIRGQYGELAQYDRVTIKDQADKAAALISDRQKLDRVISGEEKLPEGLRATAVVAAVRSDPALVKDGELLRQLASSHLASESSYSAQELRLARENAKNDPVEAIKSVAQARTKAFENKTGQTADKAVSSEVKVIRAAKPKVTPQTWSGFIDSLKC